jgi:hypothetical protein
LRLEVTNDVPAAQFGDIRRVRPSDQIVYIGWDSRSNSFSISAATVSAIGTAFNEGGTVEFLEFEGHGVPGYSGGPVFNTKGEVIALLPEAWTKRGIKGGPDILVNRAFSIEPVMFWERDLWFPAPPPPAPPTTNAPKTNSVTIRLDLK